MPLMVYNILPV